LVLFTRLYKDARSTKGILQAYLFITEEKQAKMSVVVGAEVQRHRTVTVNT